MSQNSGSRAPFLVRAETTLKNDLGSFKEGEGIKAWEVLTSPKFAKLQKYFEALKARPSIKGTWNEVRAHTFNIPYHRDVALIFRILQETFIAVYGGGFNAQRKTA